MENPSQSRGTPWMMMCQWLELKKRRSRRRIHLKMLLGLWVVRTLLSLLTVMGFSITTSNGVLFQDLPPHHIQLFRHGLFSASVIHPKTPSLSFFQKLKKFTNNAAPESVPVGLHHPSF